MCHPVKDESDDIPLLSYNNGSRFLTVDFQPEKICMMPSTGRIYHPGPEKTGGIGLLGDKLGILWTTVRYKEFCTAFCFAYILCLLGYSSLYYKTISIRCLDLLFWDRTVRLIEIFWRIQEQVVYRE